MNTVCLGKSTGGKEPPIQENITPSPSPQDSRSCYGVQALLQKFPPWNEAALQVLPREIRLEALME